MKTKMRIKRFNVIDRAFHLALMLTFLLQTATGFSRLYIGTGWGRKVGAVFGGYENALIIHQWVGVVMIVGFILHTAYLLTRINWRAPWKSFFGETSLIPNLNDFKQFGQQVRWFFGLGPAPRFNRWTYWEKFDYWAVYWGLPLLAVTGLMLMYPLTTSDFLPGWSLNIAALLHRAEAVLAASYIFIVHFFVGHLRPSSFPMNEAMFAGSVPLEEAAREKPAWVARLRSEEAVDDEGPAPPKRWYRVAYFVFGYAALSCGVYFLINGILYARYINLH
jgi:cytochrome b subunit of formate dehydrogenase